MPISIPTINELRTEFLSNIESELNINTPDNEKSYNRVLATVEAMIAKLIYLYCADRAKEAFARTASLDGLKVIGEGYNIIQKPLLRWSGKLEFPFIPYQALLPGTVFVSSTGSKYITKQNYYAGADGFVNPIVEAIEGGQRNNINTGTLLEIQTPIVGAGLNAIVTDIITVGAEAEDIEDFRQRILNAQQSERGSGTASDYRIWAQAVPGVKRAYPFTGRPKDLQGNALPLECVIYIECTEDIDPEGIAPQSLLNIVKDNLIADPDNGESRLILGHNADVIYVRPIERRPVYVTIIGLNISNISDINVIQNELRDAVDKKLRALEPFVAGVDPEYNRNEKVTESILMQETQNILDAYNGTINNILFGFSLEVNTSQIVLNRNEKLKLGEIIFEG
ncbi:MAG: hypothetical protein Pg6A_20230 [Termitinemataceae bacterium]|nr:MAG: hypothetical protein Pg6A_20230 [Termitinemataceae bacterium]